MTNHDVIVISAGHDSLVAAILLAKAGRKVLVVERRDVPGGQLASMSLAAGTSVSPLHSGGRLRPAIARELGLDRLGGPIDAAAAVYSSVLPDGGLLRLTADGNDPATLDAIRAHSARDAARWPEFVAFMNAATAFLDLAQRTPMPRLANDELTGHARPLASLAWQLRRLGKRDMFRFVRCLSMSITELTDEWFESEPLRAALGALAVHGVTLGSMSAGTGYTLLHNWLNRGGLAHAASADGPPGLAAALVKAARDAGVEIRVSSPVARVLVDRQRAQGVRLASGDELRAATVLSGADPRNTLLGLVGAPELPPEFVWATQSIRMRGSVAKVHALTDGRHSLPQGTLVVAPTLRYLERAYDASKYGEISREPYLEVTSSGAVVSIHFQFAPYSLRQGDWSTARASVEQIAVATLGDRFPGFRDSLREIRTITPLDLEQTWGLTEGDLNHGQLILDQLLFMRPMPGWSDHRTPVDGLYLCGAGVHGGGGISGVSGRNAARRVLSASAPR